jgi:hypothetical protein
MKPHPPAIRRRAGATSLIAALALLLACSGTALADPLGAVGDAGAGVAGAVADTTAEAVPDAAPPAVKTAAEPAMPAAATAIPDQPAAPSPKPQAPVERAVRTVGSAAGAAVATVGETAGTTVAAVGETTRSAADAVATGASRVAAPLAEPGTILRSLAATHAPALPTVERSGSGPAGGGQQLAPSPAAPFATAPTATVAPLPAPAGEVAGTQAHRSPLAALANAAGPRLAPSDGTLASAARAALATSAAAAAEGGTTPSTPGPPTPGGSTSPALGAGSAGIFLIFLSLATVVLLSGPRRGGRVLPALRALRPSPYVLLPERPG